MNQDNNTLINTMLELCEKHMNEGDYIESAKLLKTLYQNQLGEVINFENPIIFKHITEDDNMTLFQVIGFTKSDREHRKILIKPVSNEVITLKCCDELETFIKLQLEMSAVYDFSIENSFIGKKYIVSGNDHIEFIKNLLEKVDENDSHNDYDSIESQLYNRYTELIDKIIRYNCNKYDF